MQYAHYALTAALGPHNIVQLLDTLGYALGLSLCMVWLSPIRRLWQDGLRVKYFLAGRHDQQSSLYVHLPRKRDFFSIDVRRSFWQTLLKYQRYGTHFFNFDNPPR